VAATPAIFVACHTILLLGRISGVNHNLEINAQLELIGGMAHGTGFDGTNLGANHQLQFAQENQRTSG
jgi:hypothetical protein